MMKHITRCFALFWLAILAACTTMPMSLAGPRSVSSAELPQTSAIYPEMPEALAAGVLAIDCERYGNCSLRPVDPHTGQDIPGYTPFTWGQHYSYAFSPDRQTLALTVEPAKSSEWSAELRLVDLPAWQETTAKVKLTGWTLNNILAFSPDGQRLAFTTDTQPDRAQLAVLDLAGQSVMAQVQLDFVPWLLAFTPDGANLIVYGSAYASPAKPQAGLFKAADLSQVWLQPIPEVRDGEYPLPNKKGLNPEEMESFYPARVLSPDRRYLYLVHADKEQLTTVDFVERTVSSTEVLVAQRWFDRLLALMADTAYAKSAAGTAKQAVLSADGTRLYVVGGSYRPVEDKNGQVETVETGLGVVQAVDPATGIVLAQAETEATGIELSPDRTQLYLWRWQPDERLKFDILDAASLAEVKSLENWHLFSTRRLDGQPILLGYNFEQPDSLSVAEFDPKTFERFKPFNGVVLETD